MMNKIGIELDVETGGFVSGMASAERAVESFDQKIKQAEKDGKWEDAARLRVQQAALKTTTSGFAKDTQRLFNTPTLQTTTANGLAGIKLDSESGQVIKDLAGNIKKLNETLIEQIDDRNFEGAWKTTSQIQQEQGKYKKAVDEATAPPMSRAAQDALKAIGIGQIANAINSGFSAWAGSLNRSGIIKQYGSGDIMGGRVAEQRREANMYGGLAQAGGGIAGAIIGSIIAPGVGTMAGATIGASVGQAIKTALGIAPDLAENEAAYAGLWSQKSNDAMQLAALMGNPNMVRDAFKIAADAAAKFGYSAEEGMDAMNEAIRQGLNGDRAREITEKVFNYERSTGADRGTLASVSNMAARYGAGDALKAGWGGLGASGMSPGQYNEYLRALQRVMEDGISKGFVRSSDQVAQNLTMLAQMTDNSPLWQGENGAKRLMDMNAGLESATGLRSTSDIVAYRAAHNLSGGDYIEAMKLMERGLTPSLFNEYMRLTGNVEGGNKQAVIERMRQTFGLNYTNASALYNGWKPGMNEASLKALVDQYSNVPLPDSSSPELEAAKTTQAITNFWTQTGQTYWDKKIPTTLAEELANAIRENNKEAGGNTAVPFSMDDKQSVKDIMGGMADMPVFNEMGMPGGTFRDKMEEARNAPAGSAMNQAYLGLTQHFSSLTPEKIQNAQNLGYYPTMWYEAQGDPVKMWDILQRRGNIEPVNRDEATSGFFDYRGDSRLKKLVGSVTHIGDNDSAAMENLRDLQDKTKIDSPDYDYLMRAYNQLAAFEAPQREEVDRNNSLNAILKNNELTAQKLYDAVIELARNMGVRIIYE